MSRPSELLAPTLLATAGVTYAAVETMFFRSMLAATPPGTGDAFFGHFWEGLLSGGIAMAALCSVGGSASGAWAARAAGGLGLNGGARARLLTIGAVASLGHMAFVPRIMGILEPIIGQHGNATNNVRRWLRTHYLRTAVTDAVAFACFLAAWFVE